MTYSWIENSELDRVLVHIVVEIEITITNTIDSFGTHPVDEIGIIITADSVNHV